MFGQESSPCSSAVLQGWRNGVRSRSLGTCYLYQGGDLDFLQRGRLRKQTGKKLGHHTGGKAGRTNRIEAWTSYRGEDCENKQGRHWDISQRVDLRRIPGCSVNPNSPLRAASLTCRTSGAASSILTLPHRFLDLTQAVAPPESTQVCMGLFQILNRQYQLNRKCPKGLVPCFRWLGQLGRERMCSPTRVVSSAAQQGPIWYHRAGQGVKRCLFVALVDPCLPGREAGSVV
jgi:hypothetical protein